MDHASDISVTFNNNTSLGKYDGGEIHGTAKLCGGDILKFQNNFAAGSPESYYSVTIKLYRDNSPVAKTITKSFDGESSISFIIPKH